MILRELFIPNKNVFKPVFHYQFLCIKPKYDAMTDANTEAVNGAKLKIINVCDGTEKLFKIWDTFISLGYVKSNRWVIF